MIGLRLGQEAACRATVACRALGWAPILCHGRSFGPQQRSLP
jgi:hypothetical protein